VREHLITREISIGDFVLTGGELVAAMIADAVIRVIPGAIGDEQSALSDSFSGWLAGAARLYPAGGIQGVESAGCASLGPRAKNSGVEDGTVCGKDKTTQARFNPSP